MIKEKYKFALYSDIVYLGGLYAEYKHCKAKVVDRTHSKCKSWYRVEFEDGQQHTFPEYILEEYKDEG